MPSPEKKKDLHLASSVGDLNKLADPGLPVDRYANPATYIKSADKVYLKAQSHDLEGDEENAYVFYMRYFNIISLIKKSSKYTEKKKYYDDLMGKSKTLQSIDRTEALQKSLDKRYEKLKAQKEANATAEEEAKRKEEEDKKTLTSKKAQNNGVDSDDNDLDSLLNGVGISSSADVYHKLKVSHGSIVTPKTSDNTDGTLISGLESPSFSTELHGKPCVSAQDLYNLLTGENASKVLVLDCRPHSMFLQNRINRPSCINIPAELLDQGVSAGSIESRLREDTRRIWKKRGEKEFVILMDESTKVADITPECRIQRLKDVIFTFDSYSSLKTEPLFLDGGFHSWLWHYPSLALKPELPKILGNTQVTHPVKPEPQQPLSKKSSSYVTGPGLPPGWERIENGGRPYYKDHNTQTTHWEAPKVPTTGTKVAAPQSSGPSSYLTRAVLPPGWEKIETQASTADEFYVNQNDKVQVMKDPVLVKKKKLAWRMGRRDDCGAKRFPKELDQQEQKGVKEEQASQKESTGMQQQELERERLHEQLREKDMSMIRMEQQLRMKDGQLRQKDEKQREKDEQLREKDEELSEINEQLTQKDERLREKDDQLREKDEEVSEKDDQLREKDEELREKDDQLGEKDEQLREKDDQLREKDEQQREKDEELRQKDERLREKDEEQEHLQGQLGEMEQQLREKEQQDENLQRQLMEMRRQLTNFEEQLREREEERANLQQQNVILERQLEDKDEEINELEISLSTTQQTISEQRRQGTCDWVIARDEIQISAKCLGSGGWGSVYEGMYCGSSVAVKQIHELIISPHNRRLFEREMNIASRCRHPCLLQFIGATSDEGSPLFVSELMETSLRELLQQQQLSEKEIAVISLDVAKAINYLHEIKPEPIIHRDISSANVLLWRQGDQWRGKVSDYGTASFMKQTMTVAPGAFIYSAPEALTSNQTEKVDVYSFGVLMCEICIRELPDPGKREEQVALVTNRALRCLIRRCLQTDPQLRPRMLEIIDSLRQLDV